MRDPFLRAEVAELVQKHGLSGDAREDLEVVIRRVVTQNALRTRSPSPARAISPPCVAPGASTPATPP
ncbi:MAG: hypothetical protein IPN01_29855 [Deltaproteobacteria bacterium]|nr:hypothetical protein [Deltaproteobacteria bacterium]